ncbi:MULTISPECIES: ROK family transcriptional regulator [unclassified Bacillus (in: firmicutes)]|uniref:ROK family transcriptional regulator n=1 Tax=unclassified Bacillus (in: firmicutes) TaxID=185979 RepID=UPI000BF138DF|nr:MULTISPECIES: ROK family transcriptional regulator [unclassified Bacillus (in: firmicutes)]PEJ57628.1 hypothetical protein CN692_12120 [Bacillus sp. AFS002410]PEL08397.1 hypothetical protein CN601_16900 [Bacillus sp. AFS017336]
MFQFLNQESQKAHTQKRIYKLIWKYGPISQGKIMEFTGLKQSTCSRFIEDLTKEELISEGNFGESRGGRKPTLYQVTPNNYFVIGIDVSSTPSKILMMDLSLTITAESVLFLSQGTSSENAAQKIAQVISHMLQAHQINHSCILGIGIALENSVIDLDKKVLSTILGEQLQMKISIENSSNAAVLGEYQQGSWKGSDNAVFIHSGIGIRTGILTNAHILRKTTDTAGKFGHGHIVVDIHGRKCICGNFGCALAYSSIPAMIDDTINALKRGHSSILNEKFSVNEQINFDDICSAVQENDPLCIQVIKDAAIYFGAGLSTYLSIVHPEIVILGGPTIAKIDLFYEIVIETTQERMKKVYPDYEFKFTRPTLGENAAAIGAGCIVIHELLD